MSRLFLSTLNFQKHHLKIEINRLQPFSILRFFVYSFDLAQSFWIINVKIAKLNFETSQSAKPVNQFNIRVYFFSTFLDMASERVTQSFNKQTNKKKRPRSFRFLLDWKKWSFFWLSVRKNKLVTHSLIHCRREHDHHKWSPYK